VPRHDDDPIEDLITRSRERAHHFRAWLEQLRAGDPAFADASMLYPDDMGEWQAAVYLLTGCQEVWHALAHDVLGDVSIGPVIDELERPRRPWSGSENTVMLWAAHFWDVDRWPARFPYVFETYYFHRWTSACHLHKKIPPALTTTAGGTR
jgi:hypothetical protein